MVPLQVEDTHAMAIMASVLTKSPKSQQRNDSINHSAAPSVVATPSPQVAPLPLEFLPSASAPTDSDAAGPSPMDIDNTENVSAGTTAGSFLVHNPNSNELSIAKMENAENVVSTRRTGFGCCIRRCGSAGQTQSVIPLEHAIQKSALVTNTSVT